MCCIRRFALALTVCASVLGGVASAIDVWTPETGEVDLEELPRETPEARFRHAAALITAGQPTSGVLRLRELVTQYPKARWVEQAYFLIATGLFTASQYESAFVEWETFLAGYPNSMLRRSAFEFQLQAAVLRAREDLEKGQALFDRLISKAPDKEFAVRCQKEKADVILRRGRFFEARDEYLTLIDFFPDSVWVPYAWFKIAECDLRLAEWIKRGTQYLESAQRGFEDFLASFPRHNLAGDAQENLEKVLTKKVAGYRRIAEYYIGPGRRPKSALPYLDLIRETLPASEDARWAGETTRQIEQAGRAVQKGEYGRMQLPGVREKQPDTEPVWKEEKPGQ